MILRPAARVASAVLFVLASFTTAAIVATGGFVWRSGSFRVSLREPLNPALAAAVSASAFWILSTREQRRRAAAALVAVRDAPEKLAPLAAVLAAVFILGLGLLKGSFVAGGADSYGYVSEADLWAHGSLVVEQPYARDMTWPNVAATLAPLGYRPRAASASADLVPIYSPGLPMVMALFERFGGRRAVFVVVPILGALAVWATYVIGRKMAGPLVGACASVLLAVSPSFMFETTSPTSDVPATAWWASAFALALVETPLAAFAGGIAATMAILTRPNLAPLVVVPGLLLLANAWRRRDSFRCVAAFALGGLIGPGAVAGLNSFLYGSAVTSGYGGLDQIYGWQYLGANLRRYPAWLLASQTPIVVFAFAAPLFKSVDRPAAVAALCFSGGVLSAYLFYHSYDDWVYLRFLLPALPMLLVLTVAVVSSLFAPLDRVRAGLSAAATLGVVAAVGAYTLNYSLDRGLMTLWKTEQHFRIAGDYIARKLPARAALFAMQHSGSARYYSGRITIRYDLLDPAHLDSAIAELRSRGYAPYFLLDDWEEPLFRQRFRGHSPRADLDWWPVAMIAGNSVRIYDPTDREPGRSDRPRTPDIVP